MTRIDRVSLLADVPGGTTLAELEAALAVDGLTLAVEPDAWARVAGLSMSAWLAAGAEGARDAWLDPADHLVAGLEADLIDGRTLVVHPAPRRATGPDLVALVVGARGRFAAVRRVWIRVHVVGARRPTTAAFETDRDPRVSGAEEALLAAIARELGPSD